MKIKFKIIILILIIILFTIILKTTYSKYINTGTAEIKKDIGQWVIVINNNDKPENNN